MAVNGWRLKAFMFDADGFGASDVGDLLDSIEPGWALSSKTGVYENYLSLAQTGNEPSTEPAAREALGAHADATMAAQVLMENAPFQKPAQLLHRLVVARCESGIAGSVTVFSFSEWEFWLATCTPSDHSANPI